MFNKSNRFGLAKPIRYYAPEGDPGSGGGNANNGANNGGEGNENPSKTDIKAAVQDAIAGLLGKNNGDKDAALEYMVKRAHGLEKRVEEAKTNALSKEDKEFLESAKALGKTPAELAQIITEHGTWGEERAKNAKVASAKKAIEAPKTKADFALLSSLEGAFSVDFSTQGEGEEEEGFASWKDGDATVKKTVREWVKEKWPHLEAKIFATPATETTRTQPRHKGAPLGGGSAAKSSLDERLEARRKAKEEKKNPLMQSA